MTFKLIAYPTRVIDSKDFPPLNITSLKYHNWDDVPGPALLDTLLNDNRKVEIIAVVQKLLQMLIDNSFKVYGVEIQIPSGFQKELEVELAQLILKLKQKNHITPNQLYIKGKSLTKTHHDPDKNKGHMALLLPIIALAILQFFTTFINYHDSPEDTWPIQANAIHNTMIFLFFTKFFTTALQLSGLVAEALVLKHDPQVPLNEGAPVTALTFPVTKRDLEGSYQYDAKGSSEKYVDRPPLITRANGGVLLVNELMLEKDPTALEFLMDRIASANTAIGVGGSPEHTIPLRLTLILISNPKSTTGHDSTATSIRSSSGRMTTTIECHPIHPCEPTMIDSLIRVIKKTIDQNSPAETPNHIFWDFSCMTQLIQLLTIGSIITTHTNQSVNPNMHLIWSPEIKKIIATIAQNATQTNTPITKSNLEQTFRRHLTPLVIQLIKDSWEIYLNSNSLKSPTYEFDKTLLPSPPQKKDLSLRIETTLGSKAKTSTYTELSEIEEAFFESNTNLKDAADDILSTVDSQLSTFKKRREQFSIYDSIPPIGSEPLNTLLSKNPFALLAGRQKLVEKLVDAADRYLLKPQKPLIIVITDETRHTSEKAPQQQQFSSGKSETINALWQYIRHQLPKQKRDSQLIFRRGDAIEHRFVPVPDGPEPSTWQTIKSNVQAYIWENKTLVLTKVAEEGVSGYFLISITRDIQEKLSLTEGYAAAIFPWLLYAVNLGITGIILAGAPYLQKKFNDQDPCQMDKGGDPISLLQITASDLTRHRLLGTPHTNSNSPQTQYIGGSNITPPIIIEGQQRILFVENGHELPPDILRTLFEITSRGEAVLGAKTPIKFQPIGLCITANDPTGKVQEEAAQYADVRDEVSVLIPWPESQKEKERLIQKLLIHIRKSMKSKWTNEAIIHLISKLLLKSDSEKPTSLFFGLRHIHGIIEDAETRRTLKKAKSITTQDIDKAFQKAILNNPALNAYFSEQDA
jgi:hypothetical protein